MAHSERNTNVDRESDKKTPPITDDEIFFGSKRISLRPVPGWVENFSYEDYADGRSETTISVDAAAAAVTKTLARRGTMVSGDGMYEDCVLPGIPCLDVEYIAGGGVSAKGQGKSGDAPLSVDSRTDFTKNDWPAYLVENGPVIKVRYDPELEREMRTHGRLFYDKAVVSGVRSCLVKIGKDWYRLKGAGNGEEGFIVRVNENAAGDGLSTREIRGSAFKHTALRELYMAGLLEKRHDIEEGANSPLGMFFYEHPNAPLGGEGTDFQPVCIVEKTLGDRRLGSHVLAGIELLLPALLDEDSIDVGEILKSFPTNRHIIRTSVTLGDNPYGMITTAELMTDHIIGHSFGELNGLNWPQCKRDENLFNNNFLNFELPEAARITSPLIQYTNDGPKSADEVNGRWIEVWETEIKKLTLFLSENGRKPNSSPSTQTKSIPLLSYLYSRIGYEAGLIVRKLHKHARISWGTYSDALTRNDMAQLHCNAHTNNLVVTPYDESGKRQNFLSFLDLDMAFDEKTYVKVGEKNDDRNNIVDANITLVTNTEDVALGDSSTSKVKRVVDKGDQRELKIGLSKEDFDTLLHTENINFMEVLVGGDANSGVAQVAKEVVGKHSEKVKLVKIALYDTMLMGYMCAYNDSKSFAAADFNEKMHKAAYSLIKMAIIVQADFVA